MNGNSQQGSTLHTDKMLVVDLEATCWQGAERANNTSEIIEVGICLLDTLTGEVSQKQGILVQPEVSSIGDYCIALTTITPELIAQEAVPFAEACRILREEYQAHQYTWGSYGAFDLNMFRSQCQRTGEAYPFGEQHINIKNWFARLKRHPRGVGMAKALRMLHIPLEGTHHRGVDDAANTAKIVQWCVQEEKRRG